MGETKKISGRSYIVFLPENPSKKEDWPLAVINGDPSLAEFVEKEQLLPLKGCITLLTITQNRLDDFTPWPHKSLHERFPDFGGKADDYLKWLTTEVLPEVRQKYPLSSLPSKTGLLGQSLGGLLSLYSQTIEAGADFGHIAAISPSCWYEGFLPYFKEKLIQDPNTSWFVSSGTEEGKGHKDVKQDAVSFNRQIMEFLTERYGQNQVYVNWDEGGHHSNMIQRYKTALSWLENSLTVS